MRLARCSVLVGMGRAACLPSCRQPGRSIVPQALGRKAVQNEHTGSQPRQHALLQQKAQVAVVLSTLLAGPASAADAAVASQDNGWLSPIVDGLDFVLGNIESFYVGLGIPYPYGWSIVSLTLFVKIVTLPFTKKQVESAMAVQNLKPRIDVIKERYGDDKDKVQKETARLYEQAGVNPLAGCAPSILQLPIFFGLFRSLNNVALSGDLDSEGWLWIPSLAGMSCHFLATNHTSCKHRSNEVCSYVSLLLDGFTACAPL
jgi:YidC/Oxa1 family membrane protein insertase